MKHYIHGPRARAACSLLDEMKARGVEGMVGYDSGRKPRLGMLFVYTTSPARSLPLVWAGYRVAVEPPSQDDQEGGRG